MVRSLFITFLFLFSGFCYGQEKSVWSFEAHGGAPYNLSLPLTIKQNNHPDIKFNAEFNSEPFKMPVFWVYRFSKWKNNKSWELEVMHQKLYLKNNPSEIQQFSITHGYNQIMINRGVKINLIKEKEFIFRFGGGIVLAHPENTVRGMKLDSDESINNSGYYIGGPTFNVALAKQFKLSKRIYFNLEIKNNTSHVKVPVVNGDAYLWHSAFELIGGVGYCFIQK